MATETLLNSSNSKNSGKHKNNKGLHTGESKPAIASTQELNQNAEENMNGVNVVNGGHESSYIKEIHKNIRTIAKKLSAMSKVDAIVADNPGVTLEELVATRKINNDQRAQALKKPVLQSSLAQLEEQAAQYKKIDEEFQRKLASEREQLQLEHKREVEEARTAARAEMQTDTRGELRQQLLVLSRFLRAAAARRQMDDETSSESKAFEGVLLLLYGGDSSAVDAAEKLIQGTNDPVPSTDGVILDVTYDRIKNLSVEYAPFAAEEAWVNQVAEADQPEDSRSTDAPLPATDPTIANAGLTEVVTAGMEINHVIAPDTVHGPEQTSIDEGASNAAAAKQWDTQETGEGDTSEDNWISVPRNPLETEHQPSTVATNTVQNWTDETPSTTTAGGDVQNRADDVPSALAIQDQQPSWADDIPAHDNGLTTATNESSIPANDGFHEVHHGRGGRGRGGNFSDQRGTNSGRGMLRGTGYRGRGGYRGDRGGEGGHRSRGRGGRGGRAREAPP